MPELLLPRLSDSMEEATVVEWLKQAGDEVAVGDEVVMIETDKATVPCEATDAGTLHEILVQEGETVPLGTPLALIGESATPAAVAGLATAVAAATPAAAMPAAPATGAPTPVVAATSPRAKASPVARRIAGQHGIDLLAITGTGPDGRIVKADLQGYLAQAAAGGGSDQPAQATSTTREQELTRLQALVARRMVEAKQTIPEFVLRTEVDMEACVEARRQLQEPTYNDFVIKACARALTEHPLANGRYATDRLILNDDVHVGIAVAGEGRLVVPVIKHTDTRTLRDIAQTAKQLATKARENTLAPHELEGATFTISNLGMFGITGFTAVINPPQAAILAVGAVTRKAVPQDDAIVARHRMELSLTCDHRILYGADAARFLARVRELLEAPLALMY